MGKLKSKAWTVADYDRAAHSYCRRLPLEHFMEGIPQSTQREITLESLALLRVRIPDLQVFNELLIQYFLKGRLRRVVPDNMLRRRSRPPVTGTSYNIELEGGPPFLVFEYVSPSSHRKDYGDSFRKYEQELQVPYCLMYYPERQDLQVWRHMGEQYERLAVDERGRLAVSELDLEFGVMDGWVRFWHRGELLPLPGELQQQLDRLQQQLDQEQQQRRAANAEIERLQALLRQTQAEKPKAGRRRNER